MLMKKLNSVAVGLFALFFSSVSAQQSFRIMAPCTAGCSWDVQAHAIADTLKAEGLASGVEVYNLPGQGGALGLQQLLKYKGDASQLMTMGIGTVGGTLLNKSPFSLLDATPIARLAADFEVVFVAQNSSIKSLSDLKSVILTKPESLTWGGSSAGSTSNMMAGMIVSALGGDPKKIKFIPSSGNLQAANAVSNGELGIATSSYTVISDLISAKKIRALGISARYKVAGLSIPTLIEQGVNVEFVNWRGVMAPPGLSDRQRSQLQRLFSRMVRSKTWLEQVKVNKWINYYQSADKFTTFIDEQYGTVGSLLRNLDILK
jgi:putative tricarboxylic transport membrane protein